MTKNNETVNTNSSGLDFHAFLETLERAAVQPETFGEKIGGVIEKGPEIYIPHLIKVFDGHEVGLKGLVAGLFKGRLKGVAADALIPLLQGDNDERFSWSAAILSDLREVRAIPGLTRGLTTGKKAIISASLKGLAQFPNREALQALIDFILKSPDWIYFSGAIRYLVPKAAEAVPVFLELFPKLGNDRQAWALKFLAETGDERALELFETVLAREPLKLGLFCIHGLGKIGNAEAVKKLSDNMNHEEWFIRKRVAESLGNSKCKECLPPLIKALTDVSVQVRAAAVESLSKVGGLDLDVLVKEMEKGSHDLRVGLIKVAGQIRDPRLVNPLVRTLTDRTTLFFSIDALGDMGFPQAAPALEPFVHDAEWFNRLNALEALGKLHLPNIRDIAEKCLEDSNDMVRNAATRILANLAK